MSQTILITGAGAGIGRATARHFMSLGWQVALMGRRPDALTETAAGTAVPLAKVDDDGLPLLGLGIATRGCGAAAVAVGGGTSVVVVVLDFAGAAEAFKRGVEAAFFISCKSLLL